MTSGGAARGDPDDRSGDGSDRVREGDDGCRALGEAVAKAFRTGGRATVEADGASFFLNVHLPPPRIVAIGAVHISQALAPMAKIAGFDIEVIDPRTAFATEERFPARALRADWPETCWPPGRSIRLLRWRR
jgi:xanthine dehydrogenase accessory factor